MKEQFIADLAEGVRVNSVFALRAREMRSARTGEAYLTVDLADRTGRIGGVWFRPDREGGAVPAGGVVRIVGVVTTYRGVRRVSIESLRPARAYDREDLLATGSRDRAASMRAFRELADSVRDAGLRRVLDGFLSDEDFMRDLASCPGSQSRHHSYVGGLLDHTVAVTTMARDLAEVYEQADGDLLVTAALLHDVGKVDELTYETAVGYSDEGRLLGHVILGERRLQRVLEDLGHPLPTEKALRLSHVILAHHGELEWGAPKRPSTIEALIIHHIDNLDAKITGFVEATTAATLVEERWTDAANLFRRPLYAPRPVEDDRPTYPDEDAQYSRTCA